MRVLLFILIFITATAGYGQNPYARKLSYPDQLPTQVIYDILVDSKGYIWLGTDKGLCRFNGRSFVPLPFNNTSLRAVSYLQEDTDGRIWCMNFHNQVFYTDKDSLRQFAITPMLNRSVPTFSNMSVGSKYIWMSAFNYIFKLDKKTGQQVEEFPGPYNGDPIISSIVYKDVFYAFSNQGLLFVNGSSAHNGWRATGQAFRDMRLMKTASGVAAVSRGTDRHVPFVITETSGTPMPAIQLPKDVYVFHTVFVDRKEYWLCTQSGAYRWNPATGETKCFLRDQRVTDVVRDYEGNYWFSTLDNGIFVSPSLNNTLYKIYNDPFYDNFSRLTLLPDGNVIAGNSQGMLSKLNFTTHQYFFFSTPRLRETEYIFYDPLSRLLITDRGVFSEFRKQPLDDGDYGKNVSLDKYGNLLVAVFNEAVVLNRHYGSRDRMPLLNNPLYQRKEKRALYAGKFPSLLLRARRGIATLGSQSEDIFWVAYDDDLYEYNYNGTIRILKDREGKPIVASTLKQLPDGSLVAGTFNQGIVILKNGQVIKTYSDKNHLSGQNIRKLVFDSSFIWVLTDAGLDRIDEKTGVINNYLDEFGLHNIIINDFIIQRNKFFFATPQGILERVHAPNAAGSHIRFPRLQAVSNGKYIEPGNALPYKSRDVVFFFEALHYLSPNALTYKYRLKPIDSSWRTANNFASQLPFYRLSPGNYVFEIQATAGASYRSDIRTFAFTVSRAYWQEPVIWVLALLLLLTLLSFVLLKWKQRVINRQSMRAQLLSSQLVALRAQMNPHFLYNVLNTVQGLVYGNRRAAAGELLGNFSDLMRKVLQSSDKQLLTLKDEIENLRLYLELEKARFDKGFSYSIEMKGVADTSQIYVPSLLLQPFAENAIKHGLMHKQGEKMLDIRFEQTKDGLKVTVDDNGIGRQRSAEINQRKANKPTAFATQAIKERIGLFNRLYPKKISYEVIDKLDADNRPAGTRIELFIPGYNLVTGALWEKSTES